MILNTDNLEAHFVGCLCYLENIVRPTTIGRNTDAELRFPARLDIPDARDMTSFIELRRRRYDDESGPSLMGDKSES
jgi:hypothetical protein